MKGMSIWAVAMFAIAASGVSAQNDIYGRSITGDEGHAHLAPAEEEAGDARGAPTALQDAGGFSFAPYRATAVGSWADAVVIGDVTADGRADLVLATSFYFDATNDYSIFLFRQDVAGALATPLRYTYQPDQTASRNALGILDLDGQHGLDVVVGGGGGLSTFRSNADGTLTRGPAALHQAAMALEVLDLDRDGRQDIATVSWSSGGRIYRNRGDGTLDGAAWAATVAGYNSSASGDLDGDGDADVALASGQGMAPNVRLYRNNGDGSLTEFFSADGSCVTGSWSPNGIGIGDLNGDGLADVVVAAGGNRPGSCIVLFFGQASGGFSAPVKLPSYDIPETLRVADINGDGRDDIAVLHGGWTALGLYFQRADGTLAPEQLVPVPYASHYGAHGLAVGDFTGDGCPDVAIADYNHGLVTLQGQGCVTGIFSNGFESAGGTPE